jgi:hypothetical protein
MAGESAGCESAADPRLRRDWTALGNHRRRAEVVEIIGPQSARSNKTAAMSDSSGELDLKDDKAIHAAHESLTTDAHQAEWTRRIGVLMGVARTTRTDRRALPYSGRRPRSLGGQRTATRGSTLTGRLPPTWRRFTPPIRTFADGVSDAKGSANLAACRCFEYFFY